MDLRPPMPAFAYPAPSKYLARFLPSANPDANYLRLALQTEDNFHDFNPMTWMLLRNDVYCRHRPTRAVKKATRDEMRTWCKETMHYIPRAVFLTAVPLAGYPYMFLNADLAADRWYYASRHIEFRSTTDTIIFRLRFGALVEPKDKQDEEQLIRTLIGNRNPEMTIYL